jgi:hypothetical protein
MQQLIINSKVYGELCVKVDDEDYEKVVSRKWNVTKCGKSIYVKTTCPPKVYLHRFVLGVTDSKVLVDHRDGDGLNNQRSNIRIATRSQNNSNRRGSGYSKYLGVFFRNEPHKNYTKLWYAKIKKGDIVKNLGTFKTQEEAALAYNKAATELHGEFANLNKIEETSNLYSTRD